MAKVLSIEISNSVIRMCQMDYKKTNPRVYRHAMIDTPQGAYMDGRVLKPELLKDVIVYALKENKMYNTKDVVFSISSSKIITREVMLPAIKEKLIPNMIKANLSEYFPIDLSAYEVSHLVLEKIEEGSDAGKYKVLILAAEKHMVDSYDNLATSCGLRLVSLDYAGNSIFQAIKNEDESSRVMILKIEEKSTTVTIVNHKNLMLQRAINYGINEVIDEITKNRVFNVDNYDEAWDLAKRKACIKYWINEDAQRTSVDMSTRLENRDFDESQEIREAKIEVTKSTEQLINSIRRVIEFYASRNNGETVDQILISGCAGDINGLARLFSNEFGIKTTVLNRLEGVGWHVVGGDAGIHNYVSCIGAALNPIGFISKDRKAGGKGEYDFTPFAVLAILAALAVSGALIFLSYSKYQDEVDREVALNDQKAEYEAAKKVYDQYMQYEVLHTEVMAGDQMTLHANDNILLFLEELELALPASVKVESFVSDDTNVVITMEVSDKETAAGVIENIREFESLMSVQVDSIREVENSYSAEEYVEYLERQAFLEEYALSNPDRDLLIEALTPNPEAEEEEEEVEEETEEEEDGPFYPDNTAELEAYEEAYFEEYGVEYELPENATVLENGDIVYAVRTIKFTITGIYLPPTAATVAE